MAKGYKKPTEKKYIVPMKDLDGYLTKVQIDRILDSTKKNKRDYLLFNLLAYTGRRITEVLMLTPWDVNFEENIITWNILKKGKPLKMRIPIIKKGLMILLKEYIFDKGITPDERVFSITSRRCDQIIKEYGVKLGIERVGRKKIHCHHFRHSFIINNVRKGLTASEYKLFSKRIVGHSSTAITDWYLDNFTIDDIKSVMKKMEEED